MPYIQREIFDAFDKAIQEREVSTMCEKSNKNRNFRVYASETYARINVPESELFRVIEELVSQGYPFEEIKVYTEVKVRRTVQYVIDEQ